MLDQLEPHELLAEACSAPTTFLYGAAGLGRVLDAGGTDRDVKQDQELEVPLWLAMPLTKRGMAKIRRPVVYGERYQRKLNAGAECVSLKNLAPYFFEVGNKCNECLQDVELSGFLSRTFKQRYHDLISKGLNTMTGEEVLELTSKLATEEQQLFESGRASIVETERWLKDEQQHQQPVFKLSRKRTAEAMDTRQGGDTAKRG
jgi:GINS complex subunit 3